MTERCMIITYSGRPVNPLDMQFEDVNLIDIAHSLSLINRFNGHTCKPISVAQHSVYVSKLCEPFGLTAALMGLFHDASEYVLGDVTKWVKRTPEMMAYRIAEGAAQDTIYRALGLPLGEMGCIGIADDLMVRFEAEMGFGGKFFFADAKRYPPVTHEERERIGSWDFVTWEEAKVMFLEQATRLAHWRAGHLDYRTAAALPVAVQGPPGERP